MKYYLNLTRVKSFYPKITPTRIPIRRGRYDCDWDILKSEMKKEWYKIHEQLSLQKAICWKNLKIPMGFDESKLPKGAYIERVRAKKQ
jgi:hypothetical protein